MIQELDWVQDGIGIAEMDAVQGLIWLGLHGGSHFFDLMEQPWVFAGRNGPAMNSLGQLARLGAEGFQEGNGPSCNH